MRLVADENIEKEIVDRLRAEGHDVIFIAEAAPGIDDGAVLDRSMEAGRILLTADKDFGEMFLRQQRRTREYFWSGSPALKPKERPGWWQPHCVRMVIS